MKKVPTKADLRRDLSAEVSAYIESGGVVKRVPAGVSGKDPGHTMPRSMHEIFNEPKQERTPLTHVVAAMQARKVTEPPKKLKPSRPKKKVIYDDFGEPIRTVWIDQ